MGLQLLAPTETFVVPTGVSHISVANLGFLAKKNNRTIIGVSQLWFGYFNILFAFAPASICKNPLTFLTNGYIVNYISN